MRAWVACATFLLAACASPSFDVSMPVPEQRIAGSPLPGTLGALFPLPVDIDIQSEIAARQTGPIRSITLVALALDITATAEPAGDADDWSFVDRADLFVESTRVGSTLSRIRVATASAPGPARRWSFQPLDGVNLLDYANEGARMTASSSGRLPPDDVTFDGVATFRIQPF